MFLLPGEQHESTFESCVKICQTKKEAVCLEGFKLRLDWDKWRCNCKCTLGCCDFIYKTNFIYFILFQSFEEQCLSLCCKYTQSVSLSCWVAEQKNHQEKKSASFLRTVLDKIHFAQQHVCPHRFDDRILITDKQARSVQLWHCVAWAAGKLHTHREQPCLLLMFYAADFKYNQESSRILQNASYESAAVPRFNIRLDTQPCWTADVM